MEPVTCLRDPYIIGLSDEDVRRIRYSDTVLIQLSDGLKPFSYLINDCLKKIKPNIRIVIEISETYGACDLHLETIAALNPSLIIHIGHNKYPEELGSVPGLTEVLDKIIFIPAYSTRRITGESLKTVLGILQEMDASKISLTGTIQHVKELPRIADKLTKNGISVVIPEPRFHVMESGQILGCDYSALVKAENIVNAHVIVAGGEFHYNGALLSSYKPVIKIDPYTGEVLYDNRARDVILKRRYYKIFQAMDADSFGLVIGSKTGQYRPWLINALKKVLENYGKSYRELVIASLSRDALLNIDTPSIDAYIVTSCPRLPIDDLSDFHKPVLTPGEAVMAIKQSFKEYRFPWL
ncbi:MAG: diphthamide biosynthesis enzyme Dph2 [Desulfurococcales archaeon]|nr:diphthamide biosynthesis enzyme Dph2 [Desulfurococcales archaeon]